MQKQFGGRAAHANRQDAVDEIKVEDLIADTDMAITISHAGYIKRTSVDVYRHQSRERKGAFGARARRDFVEHLFVDSAYSPVQLQGGLFVKVYELPEAAGTRGRAISSLVKLQKTSTSRPWFRRAIWKRPAATCSRSGTVKRPSRR